MTNLNMPIMHWKQAYDRRVNMKINSISSFATPDESPIKNNNKKSSINQVIDKAADVFISEKGKELLSLISKKSNLPIITSVNKFLSTATDLQKEMLHKDILATNIYTLITKDKTMNLDYTRRL